MLREGDLVPDHALRERDVDEFNHEQIAERVADLLTCAEPPLNVALFGPWGSGKSSFGTLLRKALAQRRMKTAFVVYDAWKYSGEALQRTFIAETAHQLLGEEDPYFTSQLAQTIERMQIDLKQSSADQRKAHLWWIWRSVVPPLVIVLGLALALIILASWAASRSVANELLDHAWALAVPLLLALVAAVMKPLADTAKLKVVEGPPSEERFEQRFRSLLKKAARDGGYARFVFFIDELDRASPKDVVETLGVIKNFLDQNNAVFVVAADKQVLERAFRKLPQATPTNFDEPYYSSASEFLDKIFQHQIALPPLRGPSLFRFAHDLVAERKDGLWEELAHAEPDAARLDGVLYVLIPSHVRSPRRVKVLLNNFATNARIAQSRGVDWMARAREIAKLTVLQTEFPLLAADIDLEPRLPRLLLGTEGSVISERTRALLERHTLGGSDGSRSPAATSVADEEEPPAEAAHPPGPPQPSTTDAVPDGATDLMLVSASDQRKLVTVQQENLRRYLVRTADVPNPSRELLFLQPGGAAEGLEDPALGELLESEAVDDPAAVVAAVRDRAVDEKQAVVRVLAGMAEQAYAEERSNIITALLHVVALLDGDLGTSLAAAAGAVSSYTRTQRLLEDQLVAALRIGIAIADATGDTTLRENVLADERLLEDHVRVSLVATLLDDLPAEARPAIYAAIAEHLDETTDVITAPLRTLSSSAADRLMEDRKVRKAVSELVAGAAADDADTICADLFDALDDRVDDSPHARLRLMRVLIDSEAPAGYKASVVRADSALDAAGAGQISNTVALVALHHSPSEDWRSWLPWLDEGAPPFDQHKRLADLALIKTIGLLPQAETDELEIAEDLLPRIARVARLTDDDLSTTVVQTAQGALQAQTWWSGDALFDDQETMHRFLRALGEAIGDAATSSFAGARHADLVRGIAGSGLTAPVFRAVLEWAVDLEVAQVRDLATRLAPAPLTTDQAHNAELLLARTHLWREAWELDEETDSTPYAIDTNQVIAAAKPASARGQQLVVAWLDFDVSTEVVGEIVIGLDRAPRDSEAEAFRGWLSRLASDDARTKLLTRLATERGNALRWLGAAAASKKRAYSEQVIAHSIVSDVMKAGRADERRLAADSLLFLSPRERAAQREIGNLIVWLLDLRKKGDFETAVDIVAALGDNHGMGRSIGEAFRKASDALQTKVPHREKETFSKAKIVLGQSYFEPPPKKKSRLSRLFRG
jgi:hypothetical protein